MTAPFWPANPDRQTTTLAELIIMWRGDGGAIPPSSDWLSRNAEVRARLALWLNEFADEWGSTPLLEFNQRSAHLQIRDFRNQLQSTWSKANEFVQVLKALFAFGREQGLMRRNPAAGIKRIPPPRSYAHVFWTEDDLDRFRQKARELGYDAVVDLLDLLASTGLGLKECISLTCDDVTEYYVFRPTADDERPRRGLPAYPLTVQARALLDELMARPRKPGVDHILVDGNGAPWGRTWVTGRFKAIRDAARIENVSVDEPIARKKDLKDLSKTWAIRAMQAGATDDDIIKIRRWKHDDVAELRMLGVANEKVDLNGLSWSTSL